MARFTAHGGLRVLFSGDITSFGCESRDPIRLRTGGGRRFLEGPFGIPRNIRGVRYHGHGGRVCSVGMDSSSLGAEESLDGDDVGDERREEGEFECDELSSFRGLVLDISYRPVNVVCWKRAICLEFMEKADVLEYYDQTVSSPSGSFYIPAVLRVPQLLQVVKRRRTKHNLSRKRIFFRDAFTCQYCSSRENLTVDHVIPISRGGQWRWENLVAACARCNSRKGQKTLEETNMKLIKTPKAPRDYDIVAIPLTKSALKMLKTSKKVPQEWLQYLSKPAP